MPCEDVARLEHLPILGIRCHIRDVARLEHLPILGCTCHIRMSPGWMRLPY